ncbi:phage head closure protein [Sphingopyxis sp. PET50]|uniref:phage head closure protein n=1 Tax=Sphingopyxis sp. PET50 TaxID=2976533 RepID=UPI0021AF6E34|nr:phage head closure protein [Sphingopyxis sp. PET50]
MTTAGRRDNLVTLQRYAATQDEYGEEIQTWTDLGKEWAATFYGNGTERREAAKEQGEQAATFNVRSNALTRGLMIRDRIVFDGDNWDIVSTSPIRRAEIDLVAKRST